MKIFGKALTACLLLAIGLLALPKVFADTTGINVFGMDCQVVRDTTTNADTLTSHDRYYYLSGNDLRIKNTQTNITEEIQSSDSLYSAREEIKNLLNNGYKKIYSYTEINIGGRPFAIVLGEKCGNDVIKVNTMESANSLGIDKIGMQSGSLYIYGIKDGMSTSIYCNPSTLSGNFLNKPFVLIPSKKPIIQNVSQLKYPLATISMSAQDKFLLSAKPVSEIIKTRGGKWSQERKALANEVGIQNYRGTRTQNLQIKEFLLSKIKGEVPVTKTENIFVDLATLAKSKIDVVYSIAKLWAYRRSYDRRGLAQEANILTGYRGTRTQNLQIRSFLLDHIFPNSPNQK